MRTMSDDNNYKPHVSNKKKEIIKEFQKLVEEYPIIGAVDVENLPALQLNRMRKQLRGTVLVKMTKRRLLSIVLKNSKKEGIDKLIPYLKGMPALLFSKESPFKLYSILKKNKSKAPIKAGQTAPNDIVVPAGPTSFAPGPIIGELGALKIKAGIEGGKVAIKEDCIVAKEGDVISPSLAGVLTRLGIEPMEIGLNITGIWENGDILTKDVLDIDEEKYAGDFATAASWAFNLAVNAGILNKETIVPIIQKSHTDAFKLAVEQDIMTDGTKGLIMAKAEAQAMSLKEKLPDAPVEEKKEEKGKEDAPAEDEEEQRKPEGKKEE